MACCLNFCRALPRGIKSLISPTPPNIFEKLPPELWHMIVSYLPFISTASLALTCRHMAYTLGHEYWYNLRNPGPEKLAFLRLLDVSMPKYLLCSSCKIFHRRRRTYKYAETLQASKKFNYIKRCCRHRETARISWSLELDWWLIQLVMRAYRCGPRYGVGLKALSCVENRGQDVWIETKASIIDDHLFLKVQNCALIDPKRPVANLAVIGQNLCACNHLFKPWPLLNACFEAVDNLPRNWKQAKNYSYRSALFRCPSCPSEYLVELRPASQFQVIADPRPFPRLLREREMILCVSRWMDVGDGESPDSPEWKALSSTAICREGFLKPFDIGAPNPTIRSRFETDLHNNNIITLDEPVTAAGLTETVSDYLPYDFLESLQYNGSMNLLQSLRQARKSPANWWH
ncbi:MAG: hypothetical protein M1834_008915 [Cirrosporium novae-zelandiae]|nr:MAG: hypothetical protein M1834_008915 [Cirrosporium novae-zelandiae]